MSNTAVRILVVGQTSPGTLATLQRLERDGCGNHPVTTIAEAQSALKMSRFDVVLAGENVEGGRGYDLTESVSRLGGTLLVSVALSEALLWLPVVQRGLLTLGKRALNSAMLQSEISETLSEPAGTRALPWSLERLGLPKDAALRALISARDRRTGPDERRGQPAHSGLDPRQILRLRRKTATTAVLSIPEDETARCTFEKTRAVRRDGVLRRQIG